MNIKKRKDVYALCERASRPFSNDFTRWVREYIGVSNSPINLMTLDAVIIPHMGKPNVNIYDFESNGVWVWRDTDNGNIVLMYSDCHQKNAYKGTSFEIVTDNFSNENSEKATVDKLVPLFEGYLQEALKIPEAKSEYDKVMKMFAEHPKLWGA